MAVLFLTGILLREFIDVLVGTFFGNFDYTASDRRKVTMRGYRDRRTSMPTRGSVPDVAVFDRPLRCIDHDMVGHRTQTIRAPRAGFHPA